MNVHELTRRQALMGLAAIGTTSVFARGNRAHADSPLPLDSTQPVPAGVLAPASLTITATSAGTLGPAFGGLSYDKTSMIYPFFKSSNKELVGLFKLLGPSLLRIGGDTSDKTTWMPSGKGGVYGQLNAAELEDFCVFVKATGWKCLYTVNLGGSGIPEGKRGHTTSALAADEVAFVAAHLGSALYGIEIGNEPDSYTKPGRQYADKPWSLEAYEALWNEYREAILARTPHVVVTGPAAGKLPVWTIPFVEHEGKSKISLLTDHYYEISGSSTDITIDKLLVYPSKRLVGNLALMKSAQEKTGIPFRISETNAVSKSVPGVSDSFATALWVLDYMFTCAYGGATGINLISGLNSLWSPILDDKINVKAVLPMFYGLLLFKIAGQGTLYPAKLEGHGDSNISAFALKTATGTSLVVVNKDPAKSLNLSLQFPDAVRSASLLSLSQRSPGASGPELAASTGVTLQGGRVALDGSFSPAPAYALKPKGAQVSCYVPALSAVLVRTS